MLQRIHNLIKEMQTKEVMNPQLSWPILVHILSVPERVSHSSLFSLVLPATREAEVSWIREERERRDRGAMVTQTMSPVTGSPGSRVTQGPCDYNADLVLTTLLWFVSSIGSSLVNIVNSRNSFVTF